jgi:hypothetical protein
MRFAALLTTLFLGFAHTASAQYTKAAGQNAPMDPVATTVRAADGTTHTEIVMQKPAADKFGNAQGNDHDLAVDGAFKGQTVAVIQLYTGEGFDFSLPREALKQKGFSVFRWSNGVPTPADLEKALAKSSQLWIISGDTQLLTDAHAKIIKQFFDAGHGVYIWGDNQPYYADANFIAKALLGTTMTGDVPGDQVVGVEKSKGGIGLLPNHLLTTGLENIYEGVTIATIAQTKTLHPLIYGSADNLVAAYYDQDGKRAILDGGFTRLYLKWDTAGTARYVKNSAAWLANVDRFPTTEIAAGKTSPTPAEIAAPARMPKPIAVPGAVPVRAPAIVPTTVSNDATPDLAPLTIGALLITAVGVLGLLWLLPARSRRA